MQVLDRGQGRRVLANNGAAGMPNFRGTRYGLITRISSRHAPDALYGTTIEQLYVEAIAVHYDHAGFEREFLATWPADSPAYSSYYRRIVEGPSYRPDEAVRLRATVTA